MENQDIENLRRDLGLVSKEKQLVFALTLCERLMPSLRRFATETAFRGTNVERCLDLAWGHLRGESGLSDAHELAEECLRVAPDTEEFDHPLTSAALNAVLSVAAVMEFVADFDVDHVLEVANLAIDNAALNAQALDATPPRSLAFAEVIEHPLVRQERVRQAEDVKFVNSLPSKIPEGLISQARDRAVREA